MYVRDSVSEIESPDYVGEVKNASRKGVAYIRPEIFAKNRYFDLECTVILPHLGQLPPVRPYAELGSSYDRQFYSFV